MRLSIITINYNNAEGLRRTLASVAAQTYRNIEHVIIDAASTDGSVEVIKEYASTSIHTVIWSSEKDKGIYDGMNRGIMKATGDYIQILNSGDELAAPDVTERMMNAIYTIHHTPYTDDAPGVIYGNMIKKDYATGKLLGKSGEVEYSLRQYFSSTMNHDCCYIRRDLFDTYGLYDENLKIVSDWKWFLQAIGLGHVKPVYVDIDVTIFDASGISESNLDLRNKERRLVLEQVLPPAILADYDAHAFDAVQMDRLRMHQLYGLVYLMERVLFKLEKWKLTEFIRFCFIGVIATLIHYGIYYAIIKGCAIEKELWINVAYTVGFAVSWCCNLWLTAHFTFKTTVNVKRGVGFAASHGVNYLLQLGFLNLFLWMGIAATIAPWLVYCCVIPINFILVRTVFKKL